MSHKHEQFLRTVFHDPIGGNIHWREVESLLRHLGAELTPVSGTRVRVTLNRIEGTLHRPHHSNVLVRPAVQELRQLLARAGCTPAQVEAARAASADA